MTQYLKPVLTELTDRFEDEVMFGEVIGSQSADQTVRLGVDLEAKVSIDNGALRFDPLDQPGWGRQGVAYGPFERRAGLTFAAFLLNGHNNSQGSISPEDEKKSARRSHPTTPPAPTQAGQGSPHKAHSKAERLKENLAVGWFDHPAPQNPLQHSHALVIKGNGRSNGELWATTLRGLNQLMVGLANNPLYLVALLRESGVAFYVGSVAGSAHLPALPKLRPIAIDPYSPVEEELYAGVHQSILGESGCRADTRVYGVQVRQVRGWGRWYGTAHAADRQPQLGRQAAVGGAWSLVGNHMLLKPGQPSGLIHARLSAPLNPLPLEQNPAAPTTSLIWRYLDSQNYLALEQNQYPKKGRLDSKGAGYVLESRLRLRYGGQDFILASSRQETEVADEPRWIHVLDDGREVMAVMDGRPLFGEHGVAEARLAEAGGVGLRGAVGDFEAHPREIELPAELDLGLPWQPQARQVRLEQTFTPELSLPVQWQRSVGKARLVVLREGLKLWVDEGERVLYTAPWGHTMADLEAEIIPSPRSRTGLCFFQDSQHYLMVKLWMDENERNAVARLRFAGFESPYDQVWTRVPHLLKPGVPVRLRAVCDGERFQVYLNDEAVLYRAFSDIYPGADRFSLARVGLVAAGNGADTGSVIRWVKGKG